MEEEMNIPNPHRKQVQLRRSVVDLLRDAHKGRNEHPFGYVRYALSRVLSRRWRCSTRQKGGGLGLCIVAILRRLRAAAVVQS